MGLLDRAIAFRTITLIENFHKKSPSFHCVVFSGDSVTKTIAGMTASHGGECTDLDGETCLLLLPGALDRELFAHRISHSVNSAVLCQADADSPSAAIKIISAYL